MFAGKNWQPTAVERVTRVLSSSTRPLIAVTDKGPAIIKYIDKRAGNDALIGELVCGELANMMGLKTPDFAILSIPEFVISHEGHALVASGPAFASKWTEATALSPRSTLLQKLRRPDDVAKLVVLDTWIRNKDRFSAPSSGANGVENYDNVLLKRDKRMVELLIIDHSHALSETTIEDELGQPWVDEEAIYGLFEEFEPFLTHKSVNAALTKIVEIDQAWIRQVCASVPRQWGMTDGLADRLSSCLAQRGRKLAAWLPAALFEQYEMNFGQGEGVR